MGAVFDAADADGDGKLDRSEFAALLGLIKPVAPTARELHESRALLARERLYARIAKKQKEQNLSELPPAPTPAPPLPTAPTPAVRVLCLGSSRAGKTYLLNQVVPEKLPQGPTIGVSCGLVPLTIGDTRLDVQVYDTPGDARYARLAHVFYSTVNYALLVFDYTSVLSFEAIPRLRDAFQAQNPQYGNERIITVANCARPGLRRAVSAAYAREWCARHTPPLRYFEADPKSNEGILEALRHVALEYSGRRRQKSSSGAAPNRSRRRLV